MTASTTHAVDVLNERFFVDYPLDAAQQIEQIDLAEAAAILSRQPAKNLAPVWTRLLPDTAARLLNQMPPALSRQLLSELAPTDAVRILGQMEEGDFDSQLGHLDPAVAKDLKELLEYPPMTAGRLMDPLVMAHRRDSTAGETLERLRKKAMRTARCLFLVDDELRLTGWVTLEDVALADPAMLVKHLEKPLKTTVRPIDSIDRVTEAFERGHLLDVPVVNHAGQFMGAVLHDELAQTVQENATGDMLTMVGADKSEKALSSPWFATRKRMPWLQVNLLTAFLAAAVVGLFEATIAQVTALAVLLPVVAGQSGNAGAQALAVTMRGLALREITVRQWARVMRKEVLAGLLNGVSIALTCGVAVLVWSQSWGLVAVITSSMILAMIAAGFAGALIPVMLTKLGQDPATSSSIILTTVTDVAGFFSFLGIATLLMQFLT